MMKNFVAFLILAIWLAFGAWYYTCKVKNLCGSSAETTANVTDAASNNLTPTKLKLAYQNIFQMENGLHFEFSDEQVHIDELFDQGIDHIASFLEEHPQTSVTITGLYTSDEQNATKETNIGMARAIGIQKILENRGISPNQILINSSLEEDLYLDDDVKQIFNFKFSDKNSNFNSAELRAAYRSIDHLERNVQFYKDGEEVLFIEEPKESLATLDYYLNKNRDYFLQITGPYDEEEVLHSDAANIGLVRAYHLKGQLGDYSLNQEKLLIDSREESNIFDANGTSFPKMMELNFVFPDKEDEAKQRELVLEDALANLLNSETSEAIPLDSNSEENNSSNTPLKFGYASHRVRLNAGVRDYVVELKEYLSDYPEKNITIIGHADNIGSEEYNFELGRIRGLSARNLLVNYKISPTRIKVISEGELSPIASNDSKEGRRMNRRVELDIK